MSRRELREGLSHISDHILDVAIGVDYLNRGKEPPAKFEESLLLVATELAGWGLESLEAFDQDSMKALACWQLLERRDGHEQWDRARPNLKQGIFEALQKEYKNLLAVLFGEEEKDLKQALDFCLLLHREALAYRARGFRRLGLAA